jgi:hypothetical protein
MSSTILAAAPRSATIVEHIYYTGFFMVTVYSPWFISSWRLTANYYGIREIALLQESNNLYFIWTTQLQSKDRFAL